LNERSWGDERIGYNRGVRIAGHSDDHRIVGLAFPCHAAALSELPFGLKIKQRNVSPAESCTMLPELLPNEKKKADKSTAINRYKYLILFGEPGWDRPSTT
jgi:hypothetical protein